MADTKTSPSSSGPRTVLVVDDDPSIMLLCVQKLQHQGFTILQAPGSAEALTICSQHRGPIHLLIADLFLPPPTLQLAGSKSIFPRVHGHDLVHQIVAAKPDIRVLLMSAYSDEELKDHGIIADSLLFLRKPFTGDALMRAVGDALNGPPVRINVEGKQGSEKEKDVEWFD